MQAQTSGYGNYAEIVMAVCAVVGVVQMLAFFATRYVILESNSKLTKEIKEWAENKFADGKVVEATLKGLPCNICIPPSRLGPIPYPDSAHVREFPLRSSSLGAELED